jgi:hypothetical protein
MTMAAAIADQVARPIPRDQQPAVSLVFTSKPPWLESVESQIAELRRLSFGWDAFGAGPLRYDVLWFALSLLETVMSDDTPPPHVTPMSHEGIMLEWHRNGIDVEIEVERPGEAHVTYEDMATGASRSWTVRTNMASLVGPIERITG